VDLSTGPAISADDAQFGVAACSRPANDVSASSESATTSAACFANVGDASAIRLLLYQPEAGQTTRDVSCVRNE
jgi:hypothetical protein